LQNTGSPATVTSGNRGRVSEVSHADKLWTQIVSRLTIWIEASRDGEDRSRSLSEANTTFAFARSKERTMTTARDIMTGGVECVGEHETLEEAARKMRDLDVGSLPICGDDNRLKGLLTDRDIVIRCLAEGGDARTVTAGELGQGKPVTIGADDSIEEAIRTMQHHQIRRLPVIDGHDLVGMLSQGDIARNYPEDRVGELVEFISY
jgi:CBS domain-containing protein